MNTETNKKISFHFHPFKWEDSFHAVEKSDGNGKRRYLVGISSGIQQDLHGEKMTEKCIKSFHDQANSGDILLYEGQHGVNFVDDIGTLVKSEITPEGDWKTEYRLYDVDDGFDPASSTLEKADKLWKQVNGITPYTKPRQKGFSIEGEVPDGGIVQLDNSGRRVMDDVILDGVVVVPRPAYKDSIASAVYKTLGELPPEVEQKVHQTFKAKLVAKAESEEAQTNYFHQKYSIDDEFERTIEDIVRTDNHGTAKDKLIILFDEYSELMIELILQNEELFRQEIIADSNDVIYRDNSRLKVLKQLESTMSYFLQIRGGKNG